MDKTHQMKQARIAEFTENYLEKLFYFCLKRTGSNYEAEDLASDISLNILAALEKGLVPMHFSAWVWQIARNRYSVWADGKRKVRECETGAGIEEQEILCETPSAEEALVHREELSLLRREMLNCRMMTVHDEVNCGRLIPPEDPYHSRIAMWLALER